MKAIIFAGGVGTRLWPLSRQQAPKQFEEIVDGGSTLQMSIKRLKPDFSDDDIFISTGQRYISQLKRQVPNIPPQNFIIEPQTRDVAAAIGLSMVHLKHKGFETKPTAILWSDHIMTKPANFRAVLKFANQYITKHPDKFFFIGQVPRFASENLGWIKIGHQINKQANFSLHSFKSWHYRPPKKLAKQYFQDGQHVWNLGYFVVTPQLVLDHYQKLAPEFYQHLMAIYQAIGTKDYDQVLRQHYTQLEKASFDNLILEKVKPSQAVVAKVKLGWADIGTWESLWDIMTKDDNNNLKKGLIVTADTVNSLIYNYQSDKIIVGVGLNDLVIVNTKDVILVCPKSSSSQVKKLVKKLQRDPKYKKYT